VLALVSDTNAGVRAAACKMLAEVGGRDSIAPLEQLAKDNNIFYSGLANQALAAVKGRVEGGEKK
jgi:HEAT repeat protein